VAKAVASKPVKKAAPTKAKKAAPVVKAKAEKAPAKGHHAVKKTAAPAAGKKAAPAPTAKKAAPAKEAKESKETKAAKGAPIPPEKAEKAPKKESKAALKKGRGGKKEEDEMDDDFVSDDDIGHDEIGEYEEELKAVESLDDDSEEVVDWSQDPKAKGDEEVYLTDAEGRRYCRARDCDQAAVVDTYCRYHYLLFWKKIQVRKRILVDGKLERYIEELTSRYPDKFLEMIRRDLRTEKDFLAAIQELEIDESGIDNEMEEDTQSYIEEVRGMGEGSNNGVEDEEF
jgi:hypothetical protein